ncbi:amino acid adenylation domain-containing protein, partial [Rhodanobacter sp. ANJX3]|nr:amino acid adenylation domain-containing protein [Rhodanobacter sp. ANJX3]
MASNIVPLRVQVAPAIGIVALAQQLAQGMRRIVRRQSYRGEAIRREHGLGSGWFGPAINVMDFDCGPAFPGCQFVWHTPTIGPFDDLSIAVVDYGDGMSSQILLSDDTGGHTQSQLAAYADAMVAVAERLLHDDDPTVADLPDIWCPSVNAVLATTPYALRRRKGDGGFLQWTTRADVHAMFQAVVLDEHADNTFPWPRIAFGESAISVTRVVSLNERAWHPPGHLLAVTDEGWTVATGDGDILLSGFLGEDLQPEHPSAASHRFGLHPGDRLPEGVAATPDTSCFALASIHDAEPFWAARLARYRSQRIPGLAMDEAGSTQHVTAWCDLPECARNRNGYGVDVFVAALAAYISRATGETAIQMGWRVESHASTGDLVASLAKCVPLEIEVDYSSTLDELAQLAAAERACVTGHASYFIELPVRHPLCRANAALRRAQPWQVGICIALADEQPLANLITGRELTLQICLASMCYRWIIAGDHADRASVHFVTEGVERLLHEGLEQAHVAVPVAQLPLLGVRESRYVIEHLNATTAVYPEGRCLHELFELQVARVPQAHALMHRGQPWTYAQLDHEADRLAQVLVSEGVGRASLVGLCVDRTPWLIVGMLAILKAGGAYVPLDPAYPTGRLQWVCEDAAPRWLVCDATGRAALGDAALTQRCVLDVATAGTRATAARAVRPVDGSDRDVAYVIYTSGSTGTPKGVLIEHAQATNLVYWAMDAFDAHERARVAFCTSVQFDLSVFECFVPLCSGGTVYLLDDALALPSVAHDVTLINTVPSAIGALLDGALPATTTATVNLAGEPLRSSLVERLFAHTAVSRICNLYGPSETTTYSTWTAMHRDEPREETIGRPLANTQIYLLDAHAQPVPLGSPGEIYIGGRGVARGYLGRAELTASRFVRDPFTSAADARMYRTGDLARYLPDGRLVYLGRNDHQVKIRGFRIELGEIEARLIAHDAVREAIVTVAPGGEDTQPRLLAYLIGTAVDAGTLREHLATGLPEYMLPAAYIWLDAWPLTPNGKLDRQALPQPDEAAYARHTYEEPQGDIEIALAQWWSELLGVAKVGRRDDFFALGGHSLVAMRLLSRLRQRFAIDLPLATVFERPVLAALAAALTATGTHAASTAIAPRAPDTAPSLSFAQQRLWFLSRMGAAAGSYHLPLVLRLRGALSPMALRAALGALLVRHEALRTVFIDHDGEPQARLLGTDIALPWTVVDLRTEPATLSAHVQTAIGEAFDLAVGPLIRAHLYRTGDDEHVLLLTQHHIVSDGWSMDILLRELVACYEA